MLATRAAWFYRVNQDAHSQSDDPQFLDAAIPSGTVGFSQTSVGARQTIDNSSAGFSETGTWTSEPDGVLGDNYSQNAGGYFDTDSATWTVTGLTPGSYYRVAASWPANNVANASAFSVTEGGNLISTINVDQTQPPADYTDTSGVSWKTLALFYVTSSTLTVQLKPQSTYYSSPFIADAVQVQQVQGVLVDDFHVASTSPTIDAADPVSPYFLEPGPNGDRANIGADGDTSQANPSAAQTIQVLAPFGLQKVQVGQSVPIQWQTSGLTASSPVAFFDAGGGSVGNWLSDSYRTDSGPYYYNSSFTNPVDTSGVTNPAPQAVYQSYASANYGVGQQMSYSLPVPDGTYTVRLHFADNGTNAPGERSFDIDLQGSTVESAYDIFADAGAADKATTQSLTVTATGGQGIQLSLVNDTYSSGHSVGDRNHGR